MKQTPDDCLKIEYEGQVYYVKNPQRNWSGYYMYRCDAWVEDSSEFIPVSDPMTLDKLAKLFDEN